MKADVLPAGLALGQVAPGGEASVGRVAPAHVCASVPVEASARFTTSPAASAEALPMAQGSGSTTRPPISAATTTPTPGAQAKAAPPSQAHASHTPTKKGTAKKAVVEDGIAGEEGWP